MTPRIACAGLALSAAALMAVAACGHDSHPAASSSTAPSTTVALSDVDAAKVKLMCQEVSPLVQEMNKNHNRNDPSSSDVVDQALSQLPPMSDHDKALAQTAAQKALSGKCD